jgi:hypothetical protein
MKKKGSEMKKNIGLTDFINEFQPPFDKEWTRDGLILLYNYLIELEKDTRDITFDLYGINADYTQYTYEDVIDIYCEEDTTKEEMQELKRSLKVGDIIHGITIIAKDNNIIVAKYN